MRVVWRILKVFGMAFVVLECVRIIQRMAMVSTMTGNWLYPIAAVLVACATIYWAYRVIWRPILPK